PMRKWPLEPHASWQRCETIAFNSESLVTRQSIGERISASVCGPGQGQPNRRQRSLRACFENRPVRGPGLQGCRNRIVSCRPRALTRRFGGFLKHALNLSHAANLMYRYTWCLLLRSEEHTSELQSR